MISPALTAAKATLDLPAIPARTSAGKRLGGLALKALNAVDLRAALGLLRLLPREALHRAPTPPPTAQQREDVGAILRARLAQLEALPDGSGTDADP